MMHSERAVWIVAAAALLTLCAACSGAGSPSAADGQTPAPSTSGTTMITVSGTTRQTSVNACGGEVHTFDAADGEIKVTLTATNDPNMALSVQVCSGNVDVSANCTIAQQKIQVGQTLAGTRKPGAAQTLKFLPYACVFLPTVDTTPINYTATVTYQK